jgi:hypothetical protein
LQFSVNTLALDKVAGFYQQLLPFSNYDIRFHNVKSYAASAHNGCTNVVPAPEGGAQMSFLVMRKRRTNVVPAQAGTPFRRAAASLLRAAST